MSSRLALPVSGPAHKDRDTYTVAAGTFSCARCAACIKSKAEGNAHQNWDTVYIGEKGFYCD
ncbi:hypothetical protein ALC60_04116 [Trachymyrmex zeteki]|uniref:Uncharacterized protein n=1 Tax=Mycetomoellerius zeteki TaxID=64791 RepID=A0A151X972_9HYME|nr:hypothetical protein ALC60_04116 [Trachymyrmex zeteki]